MPGPWDTRELGTAGEMEASWTISWRIRIVLVLRLHLALLLFARSGNSKGRLLRESVPATPWRRRGCLCPPEPQATGPAPFQLRERPGKCEVEVLASGWLFGDREQVPVLHGHCSRSMTLGNPRHFRQHWFPHEQMGVRIAPTAGADREDWHVVSQKSS